MGAAPNPPSLLRKTTNHPQLHQPIGSMEGGDHEEQELPTMPSTPVGVTIAFRQQEGLAQLSEQIGAQSPIRTPSPTRIRTVSSPSDSIPRVASSSLSYATASTKRLKKPVSSWQVFWEGASLYLACLILPSVIGSLYQRWAISVHDMSSAAESPSFGTLGEQEATDSYSYYYDTLRTSYDHYVKSYACSIDPSYYSPTLGSYYTYYLGCDTGGEASTNSAFLFSPDTTPLQDLQMVAVLSVCMALVRSLIVTYTVLMHGRDNAETVQAMVRCKSVGLLSADYGALTPSSSARQFVEEADANPSPVNNPMEEEVDVSHLGLGLDDSSNAIEENDYIDAWGMNGITHSPDQMLAAALADNDNQHPYSASLYSAPRYATALFRLGYSLTASSLAYVWFHRASFWPWFVGGSGSTAACWDLSGGLTLGMDSDFDHRNLVLKRYFLLQASYHWQSIAFHLLSLVMLIWDFQQQMKRDGPAKPGDSRGLWSIARKTTVGYSRSLLQHLLALVLIAVAYVFSSLRRLGAIGMFAGDVSSCFLHLLQLLLNKSSSRTNRWVRLLYYGGVLPSFVVMRLCVWPRLWYSATVESHSWFQQLERTLFPNSALALKCILHVWMLLVTYLTIVGLRRLYRHPHLQRSLR